MLHGNNALLNGKKSYKLKASIAEAGWNAGTKEGDSPVSEIGFDTSSCYS